MACIDRRWLLAVAAATVWVGCHRIEDPEDPDAGPRAGKPFVTEKSDIDVRAAVRSNNSRVTSAYDMILIKNGGPL